jgi:hypothetical protein
MWGKDMKFFLQKLVLVFGLLVVFQPASSWAELIRCADCGRMVSSLAESCPECGRPMKAAGTPSRSLEKTPPAAPVKASFKNVHSALVLIQSGGMVGSGFIVEIDGKRYVLTNAHVLESLQSLSLRNLAGDKLAFTKAEFANDQDLVRLRLAPTDVSIRPLAFSADPPSVGDVVVVYGNSQGSDVVTELTGRVLGVGPDQVEVDAEFVQGNSGSPILNAQGEVIAIATYITQTSKNVDWVTDNTRFQEPRRFGITPRKLTWVTIDGRKLKPQLNLLSDVDALATDLSLLMENWRPHSDMRREAADMLANYTADSAQGSYTNTGWPQSIERFCKAYMELARNDARIDENGRHIARVSKTSFQYRRTGADRDKALQTLCKQASGKLLQTKWATDYFQIESAQYVEWFSDLAKALELVMKTPAWGRYVDPGPAVPSEWGARPGLQK